MIVRKLTYLNIFFYKRAKFLMIVIWKKSLSNRTMQYI